MFSIRTDRCSSPRPATRNLSVLGRVLDLQRHVVQRSRARRRSLIWRLVGTCRRTGPWPANGELLTWKVIEIVGSSTVSAGGASGASSRRSVSEMVRSWMPDGDDVAGLALVDLDALQAHEAEHLQHLAGPGASAFAVDHRDRHVLLQRAALDAADADHADEVVVVQLADAHLERAVAVDRRRRHVLHDRLEQRVMSLRARRRPAGITVQRRGVDDREVELLVGGAGLSNRSNLVDHPVRARAGAVDLVDHDDRAEAHRERLLGDEARLRHRAVHRIDQDQHRSTIDSARPRRRSRRGPGVDDVDAVARQRMAVFLARMVMPRSFSWSLLSITRSASTVRSLSVPDCFSRRSTRVVLPWSTWATMAMLRRRSTELGADMDADMGQRREAGDNRREAGTGRRVL